MQITRFFSPIMASAGPSNSRTSAPQTPSPDQQPPQEPGLRTVIRNHKQQLDQYERTTNRFLHDLRQRQEELAAQQKGFDAMLQAQYTDQSARLRALEDLQRSAVTRAEIDDCRQRLVRLEDANVVAIVDQRFNDFAHRLHELQSTLSAVQSDSKASNLHTRIDAFEARLSAVNALINPELLGSIARITMRIGDAPASASTYQGSIADDIRRLRARISATQPLDEDYQEFALLFDTVYDAQTQPQTPEKPRATSDAGPARTSASKTQQGKRAAPGLQTPASAAGPSNIHVTIEDDTDDFPIPPESPRRSDRAHTKRKPDDGTFDWWEERQAKKKKRDEDD